MRWFYSRSWFIPIHHEYLLIWERSARTLVQVTLLEGLRELESRAAQSWRSIVRLALMKLGGPGARTYLTLTRVGLRMRRQESIPHWQASVRQML
ncbi:MAG: hypothetical protein AB1898_11475 [Acidobacteriota bacterium]